jgi:hypothetical protein
VDEQEQGEDQSQNVNLPPDVYDDDHGDDDVDTDEVKPLNPLNMPSQVNCCAILVHETCFC